VPVLGVGTDEMPGFYTRSAGVRVDARVENAEEAARVVTAHWQAGFHTGVLVTVPLAEEDALSDEELQTALHQAEAEAAKRGIQGPAVTPYILAALARLTQGHTVEANLKLLRQNAHFAAQLAGYLAQDDPIANVR